MFDTGLAGKPPAVEIILRHLEFDYAGIRTFDALVAAVERRYSLPHARSKRDGELRLREVRPSTNIGCSR
jgi:hypothetical protein